MIFKRNLFTFKILLNKMENQFSINTKFINYKNGAPQNMFVEQRQLNLNQNEFLMKVKAVGLNRAECLQRMGRYVVTKEVQKYLGLEASGQIIDVNTNQKLFDGIALLSGGSYSQWAIIPKDHVMKLPEGLSYAQGAAIPEAWLTAFQLLKIANLKQGDNVVIYAGASGVGTAAIQICQVLKYNAYAVVSNQEKRKLCLDLGAKGCALYKGNQKWDQDLIDSNNGKNFTAVLDCVGVSNIDQTINLLQVDGRWVLYGLLSGVKAEFNFMKLMQKRIQLLTSLLKTRTHEYKTKLIFDFSSQILGHFNKNEQIKIKPVIYQVLKTDFSDASKFIQGHRKMESNENSGKIILQFE